MARAPNSLLVDIHWKWKGDLSWSQYYSIEHLNDSLLIALMAQRGFDMGLILLAAARGGWLGCSEWEEVHWRVKGRAFIKIDLQQVQGEKKWW